MAIKVLLFTPDPTDADFIRNALNGKTADLFDLQSVHPPTESLTQFVTNEATAVLVDAFNSCDPWDGRAR